MFQFEISNYEDALLEEDIAELLTQRLENQSRQAFPQMWKATDWLNDYNRKGMGRLGRRTRYRIYGLICLFIGSLFFIIGLFPPQNNVLIVAGLLMLATGILEFVLSRKKKAAEIPDVCKKEAAKIICNLRSRDWSESKTLITIEKNRIIITTNQGSEQITNDRMSQLYVGQKLWLVVYDNDRFLFLQKKDLVSADGWEKLVKENDRG